MTLGTRRASWLVRTGWAPLLWLLAAAAAALRGLVAGVDGWLPIHLVMLGAVSNVVLVWSAHFANAVLRTRGDGRRGQAVRLVGFNAGAVLVVVGVSYDAMLVLAAGAGLVALAVVAHAVWLVVSLRASLPARFAPTVHYYIAAAAMLVAGIAMGIAMEAGPHDDPFASRLLVAHLTVNLVGWISLTVIGTLVTLWPTMLRTQMGDGAERVTFAALPWFVVSVSASAISVLLDWRAAAAISLIAFLLVLALSSRALIRQARGTVPRDLPAWSVVAGIGWLVAGLVALAVVEFRSPDWDGVADAIDRVVLPCLVLGFAVQTVVGALTYLVPVMLGGGPAAMRRSIERVGRGGRTRLVLLNAGVLVAVASGSGPARVAGLALAMSAVLVGVATMVLSVPAARRSVRADGPGIAG